VSKPVRKGELFSAIEAAVKGNHRFPETSVKPMSVTASATQPAILPQAKQPAVESSLAEPGIRSTSTDDDPLAGDPELRKELAVMFLEDCPILLSKIRAAVTQRDGPSLKLAAHTLKGSAGVFKIQSAFDAALRMEQIGKECDWDHAEDAWKTIDEEMARLSATLVELQNPGSPLPQELLVTA
jgi:HPt (histidine-containing phosphotransfer) domain-containing protein